MNKQPQKQAVDVLAPSPGESINEVMVSRWLVKNGQFIKKDQPILEIESEKASLQIAAEQSGTITITAKEGTTVNVGDKLAEIKITDSPEGQATEQPTTNDVDEKKHKPTEPDSKQQADNNNDQRTGSPLTSPAAAKMMAENDLTQDQITGSGPKNLVTKGDVLNKLANQQTPTSENQLTKDDKGPADLSSSQRQEQRQPMSLLRKKISERLVAVKNETAMLTTFNEVDMSAVMATRSKYKEIFKKKHDIGLGFMSFFAKACTQALQNFPLINGKIEQNDIISHNYIDLGIAVSSPKGLMVPIVRNAQNLTMADIEKEIVRLAEKAKNGTISIDDMSGGTFTITNGGIFGSMLSTPILNPPQSAILGMHNIVNRPVVIDSQIVVRPIMYLALSYDHRIVDGKEAVSFLVNVKNLIEDPVRLLLNI